MNQNTVLYILGGLLLGAAGFYAYNQFVAAPALGNGSSAESAPAVEPTGGVVITELLPVPTVGDPSYGDSPYSPGTDTDKFGAQGGFTVPTPGN